MRKNARHGAIFAALLCCSCLLAYGAEINRAAARKLSDSFIAALKANDMDAAVKLMAPEYVRKYGGVEAKARIEKFLGYCGRPVDSKSDSDTDERGMTTYPGGHRGPFMKFYYYGSTTLYLEQTCWFMITVGSGPTGLKVIEYGAVKQFGGEI